MPHITANTDPRHTAAEASPETATRTRISRQRATRIREFIRSHLPTHIDVEVIITPHVSTAAVLPADVDAVLGADATDVDRTQAERLLDGVDADFLVLVTGNAAPLDRIPLNDQLTADHAHQFGLAFHELLHVLKTAIVAIGQLIDEEIDEQYHEQVHDLINIIEDGAIESEAIHGENFSDNAGIRLELTRRIHSQTPDDIPDDEQIHYSFWDAVTSTLYDRAIYPTGITDCLLEPADERIVFTSNADQQAFEAVHDALEQLAIDALAIKSAAPDDTTHSHNKDASVRRARRVIETWNTAIQPILKTQQQEQAEDHGQSGTTDATQQERDLQSASSGKQDDNTGPSDATGGQSTGEGETEADDLDTPASAEPLEGDQLWDGIDTSESDGGNERPSAERRDDSDVPVTPVAAPLPDDFDPGTVSLDREATDDPYQDVFEQPAVTPDPDPHDVDETDDESDHADFDPSSSLDSHADAGSSEKDGAGGREDDVSSDVSESGEHGSDDERERGAGSEEDGTTGSGTRDGSDSEGYVEGHEPESRAQELAEAAARVREQGRQNEDGAAGQRSPSNRDASSVADVESAGSQSQSTSDSDQLTFDDLTSGTPKSGVESTPGADPASKWDNGAGISADSSTDTEPSDDNLDEDAEERQGPDTGSDGSEASPEHRNAQRETEVDHEDYSTGEEREECDREDSMSSTDPPVPDTVSSATSPGDDRDHQQEVNQESHEPAHAQSAERSTEETREAYDEALDADRKAAHDEAVREGIDQDALERELDELAATLEREQRRNEPDSDASGGSRGGPGHLDEIELLPISDELVSPREWDAVEEDADHVAGTLEKQLRLERRRGERTGITAGTYDTRAGHRLAIGDPRVCKTKTPGREKRYCLVLVLDRSGSMRHGSPPKIEVATQALARFAVAAEALGIAVAVIDFIRGQARLVKPFAVETRHVQATLLDTSCGGGTPLADAIGLARQLIENQRDEPLIITVTDDEPSSVEDVIEQIRDSNAPVCSLTIATDCAPGTLSPDASELAAYYERQAAVYTPERLDDRLDQFASLLAGL